MKAKVEKLIPDISGFQTSDVGHQKLFPGLIQVQKHSNATLSIHTLQQMLSAQQTGDKVGFIIYSDRPSAVVLGGDGRTYDDDFERDSVVGVDEWGNEYVIVMVTIPKDTVEIAIDSVTVLSRDKTGAPNGDSWSALGSRTEYSSGSGYSSGSSYTYRYKIQHDKGKTTLTQLRNS